jgi:PAS domain-containing protein
MSSGVDDQMLFRGLLEAEPDAIVGISTDGLIMYANAQTRRLFGYDRGDLIGNPIELLVPEAARVSQFPADIGLSALETDEGPLVSAAIRDITERLGSGGRA